MTDVLLVRLFLSSVVVTALSDMLTEVDQRREVLAKQRVAAEQVQTENDVSNVQEHQVDAVKHNLLFVCLFVYCFYI